MNGAGCLNVDVVDMDVQAGGVVVMPSCWSLKINSDTSLQVCHTLPFFHITSADLKANSGGGATSGLTCLIGIGQCGHSGRYVPSWEL